jgi:hypothetical protein
MFKNPVIGAFLFIPSSFNYFLLSNISVPPDVPELFVIFMKWILILLMLIGVVLMFAKIQVHPVKDTDKKKPKASCCFNSKAEAKAHVADSRLGAALSADEQSKLASLLLLGWAIDPDCSDLPITLKRCDACNTPPLPE